jgi:hypothetical protein
VKEYTLDQTTRLDGLAVVPTEASLLDPAPGLELRPVTETGEQTPVAYVAPRRGAEIVDVIFAVAALASKPLRRRPKH